MTRASKALATGIAASTLAFFCVGAWKYAHYRYTGIDLAYFAQVFWNTIHGRPFAQSIHPHLSLGDHAELAIPLIALPYALWQDPRMLLLLQALALALPAWPFFLIARGRLAGTPLEKYGPAVIAAAWLLHPAVQNPALFEFHVLPFALVPLSFALLAYERGRKASFLFWCLAALLAREDVALVVAMIGVLAMIERRKWWWVAAPALAGGAWFLAATRLIARFEPAGGYKYMIYYSWLGATPLAAARGILGNLGLVFRHVATVPNLELLLGLTFPLLFLPLVRPKRLVLALGPVLQTVLSGQGGGALTFQTHYAVLFLPGLFLAAIDGLRDAPAWFERRRFPFGARELSAGLLVASVYGTVTLGPLPASFAAMADPESKIEMLEGDTAISAIPADVPAAASYRLLPHLAAREGLYSLHYQFLGVTQYAEAPYAVPSDVRVVASDRRDLLAYRAQYAHLGWAAPHLEGGEGRLRELEAGAGRLVGPYEIFGAAAPAPLPSYETSVPTPEGLPPDALLRAEVSSNGKTRGIEVPVESPATRVSIPLAGFEPGKGVFSWTYGRNISIYAMDDLRTPVVRTLSETTIEEGGSAEIAIPAF